MISDVQPIETAPTDGTKVLVWAREFHSKCGFEWMIGWRTDEIVTYLIKGNLVPTTGWKAQLGEINGHEEDGYGSVETDIVPTHWMRLPPPPEGAPK